MPQGKSSHVEHRQGTQSHRGIRALTVDSSDLVGDSCCWPSMLLLLLLLFVVVSRRCFSASSLAGSYDVKPFLPPLQSSSAPLAHAGRKPTLSCPSHRPSSEVAFDQRCRERQREIRPCRMRAPNPGLLAGSSAAILGTVRAHTQVVHAAVDLWSSTGRTEVPAAGSNR
jgi:hypothetical protein